MRKFFRALAPASRPAQRFSYCLSLKKWVVPLVAGGVLMAASLEPVQGGGVVSDCTEAALRTALSGGGLVTFSEDCSITLTEPLVVSSGSTTIDASGHAVTLSGGGSVWHFTVGANLTLLGLTLTGGYSTNGGGAMTIGSGAVVVVSNCVFSGNSGVGTSGTNGVNGVDSTYG